MKKTLKLLALSAAMLVSVVSCGGTTTSSQTTSESTDSTTSSQTTSESTDSTTSVEEVPEGFTSLANQNANSAIDADGNYEYAGIKFATKKEFKSYYTTEPSKAYFNYLTNSWTYNSEHYTNMVDGLVENDKYGNIVGALATSYKNDGKTWTFRIRQGVKWVDNKTGTVVAEVKAQDFVEGIKYVLDPLNGSATVGIVASQLEGAADYYDALSNNEDADFSTVGVKAIDDYTVEYTTVEEMPYFLTCLTYSPYLPVNGDYLDSEGTDFGTSADHILVNGAFRLTTHTYQSAIIYTKNDKYYDADHVYVDKVTKTFYDSSITTPSTTREWFEQGIIDSFTVSTDDEAGYKKYVTGEDGSGSLTNPYSDLCNAVIGVGDATYVGYYNFVRDYETAEYGDGVTAKTAAQGVATQKALANKKFRQGFLYGLEVMEYLQRYGSERAAQYLMRGYTNRELCSADGKDYAEYVEDVFNEKQGTTGVHLAGIYNDPTDPDPVFDAEKAKALFAEAKAELIDGGMSESDFPILIDTVGSMNATIRAYEDAMFASLNEAGKGVIEVRSNVPSDNDTYTKWMNQTYNYDFSMLSGWGPDYADPQTFAHTFCINGDMVESLGFDGTAATNDLQEEILGEYDALYQKAAAITDGTKLAERYQAFAEAEYNLIYESAIIIPWLSGNGYSPVVSRTVAHQAGKASYGLTSDKLKNVVVTSSTITKAQRAAIDEYYEANK
jgi:oligopeptide transport system substrate-binding protein